MKCLSFGLPILAIVFALTASYAAEDKPVNQQPKERLGERVMQIHYLEIVTKDVDAVCATYATMHNVKFSEPNAGFGNARTAPLPDGGLVGVRAPMRDSEEPIVRPYWLVDDIKVAVAAAEKAGCTVAHPPMEIPGGLGTFAIYLQGGIDHGLWQR